MDVKAEAFRLSFCLRRDGGLGKQLPTSNSTETATSLVFNETRG